MTSQTKEEEIGETKLQTHSVNISLNEKIESIFTEIGEFGRYQLLVFILVGIISFVPAIVGYSFGFYAATPLHRLIFLLSFNLGVNILSNFKLSFLLFALPLPLRIDSAQKNYFKFIFF